MLQSYGTKVNTQVKRAIFVNALLCSYAEIMPLHKALSNVYSNDRSSEIQRKFVSFHWDSGRDYGRMIRKHNLDLWDFIRSWVRVLVVVWYTSSLK